MVVRYRDGVVPAVELDPALVDAFGGIGDERRRAARPRRPHRARSTTIWERVRRLNRYVEERAPWQLAKDEPSAPPTLDATLASLAEGLRVVAVLLHPYMPDAPRQLLAALGDGRAAAPPAALGARRAARRSTAIGPLFPRIPTRVIDRTRTSTSCERPDAELVARRRGGRRRIV